MLLTRKSSTTHPVHLSSGLVAQLARGLSHAVPTVDRRAFLRRGLPLHFAEKSAGRPFGRLGQPLDGEVGLKTGFAASGCQDPRRAHRIAERADASCRAHSCAEVEPPLEPRGGSFPARLELFERAGNRFVERHASAFPVSLVIRTRPQGFDETR